MTKEPAWAVRTVESIIARYSLLHEHPHLGDCWNYESGVMLKAIRDVHEWTEDDRYLTYIRRNIDHYVNKEGEIRTYHLEDYNLDQINQGKLLLFLYRKTQEDRYRLAFEQLFTQLLGQPRTEAGGFWHKKIYPYQMWLDGLYMAQPFVAEYAWMNGRPELFDDIAHQLLLAEKRTRNPATGLLHHAWDESREQEWADPEHGRSPHAWGRAIGWYCMAVVDVLDYLPVHHAKRGQLIGIFERLIDALVRVQDEKSGVWHQVLGQEGRPGNYPEASCTAMIVYAGLKALRLGYLSGRYLEPMVRAHDGMLRQFAEIDEQGHVHVHRINRVAGLGGHPYRDGSYTYYVQEEVVSDDPKGVAPFIMACLEYERLVGGPVA
jgi:unsaturated rhamnogalacturonyl hydrolase